MKKIVLKVALLSMVLGCLPASRAIASTITFEDVYAGATPPIPSAYSDAAAQGVPSLYTTVIGGVTFSINGGVPLFEENLGLADNTTVYATASEYANGILTTAADGEFFNPLTITFSQAVTNFGITIGNGVAGSYEVLDTDNAANFFIVSLPDDGFQTSLSGTLPFAAQNITVEFLGTGVPSASYDTSRGWDFAVDDISFDDVPPPVPEPGTLLLLGGGLAALAARRRRRA